MGVLAVSVAFFDPFLVELGHPFQQLQRLLSTQNRAFWGLLRNLNDSLLKGSEEFVLYQLWVVIPEIGVDAFVLAYPNTTNVIIIMPSMNARRCAQYQRRSTRRFNSGGAGCWVNPKKLRNSFVFSFNFSCSFT